jgi:hypothetical protein
MSKIEKIENEIRGLTDVELAALRKWFIEFDADAWDRQIERDSASGRLAQLAKKSISDHDTGSSTEL